MSDPLKPRRSAPAPDRADVGPFRSSRPMDPIEAAEYLRLNKRIVTAWARKGYIPAHPIGEGSRKFWRFFEYELEAWLKGQNNGTNANRV